MGDRLYRSERAGGSAKRQRLVLPETEWLRNKSSGGGVQDVLVERESERAHEIGFSESVQGRPLGAPAAGQVVGGICRQKMVERFRSKQ